MTRFKKMVEFAKAIKASMQTGHSFHVSFLMNKGGAVVIFGVNNYNKSNRISHGYLPTKNSNSLHYHGCIHSELDLLGKIKYWEDLGKYTIVNVRINNNGEVANSKPCKNCAKILRTIIGTKIKKMFHTNEHGDFERTKL